MTTDPIADFLIRLQNASRIGKSETVVPFSQMKLSLAEVLAKEGYIGDVSRKKDARAFSVSLRYGANGRPAISGSKRISKPSSRMYLGVHDIRLVKHGHGLLVLSTPQGVMSGKEA